MNFTDYDCRDTWGALQTRLENYNQAEKARAVNVGDPADAPLREYVANNVQAVSGVLGSATVHTSMSQTPKEIAALRRQVAEIQQNWGTTRSEEHTSELQSLRHLVCRLLLEKK